MNYRSNTVIKSQGMTLLEIMLVLAIATSIILMGVKAYQSYNTEKDYFILKANVDLLFQAMKGYYQVECNLYNSMNSSLRADGVLTSIPASNYVTFDVSTVGNYVATNWPRNVSVVKTSGTGSYKAQFNYIPGGSKNACVVDKTDGQTKCSSIAGSNIMVWQSQIAVEMKDPTKTTYYVSMVGADCAVNDISTPVQCATQGVALGASARYMVWQRLPSFSSEEVRSSFWLSNPVLKQFNLQYTHDPMYEMYNSNATPTNVYKYYYCGG